MSYLSVSLSASFCDCLSFFLSLSLTLSLSCALSPFLSLSFSPFPSVSSFSLSFCLSLSPSLSLSFSLSFCLFLSLARSISLPPYQTISPNQPAHKLINFYKLVKCPHKIPSLPPQKVFSEVTKNLSPVSCSICDEFMTISPFLSISHSLSSLSPNQPAHELVHSWINFHKIPLLRPRLSFPL